MQKRVDRRMRRLIHLFAWFPLIAAILSAGSAVAQKPVPCLANNVIPPGQKTCVAPDGRVFVAPPPAAGPTRGVIVEPPPASGRRSDPSVNATITPTPTLTPTDTNSSSSTSVWWTVGGVGAIAALLTAVAAVINAVRRKP